MPTLRRATPRRSAAVLTVLAVLLCAPAVVVGCSAAGVVLAASAARTVRGRALVSMAAAASTALGLLGLGAPLPRAVSAACAVVVGGVTALLVADLLVARRARRRAAAPEAGRTGRTGTAPAISPADVVDLGLGAAAGSAAGLLVGGVLAQLAGLGSPGATTLAWATGSGSSAFVALVLRALVRRGAAPGARQVRAAELAAVWGVWAVALGLHLAAPGAVPLALASLAGVLWAALRLPARAVAVQLGVTCLAVVAASAAGLVVMTDGQASLGELALVVLVVVSVREAHLAEQARATAAVGLAHHHEQVLTGVLDGATEQAVIATSPDLVVTLFSAGAERMLGWSSAEAVGQHLHTVSQGGAAVDDEVRAALDAVRYRCDAGGVTTSETAVSRDGRTLEVLMSTSPRRSPSGAVEGYVVVLTDVSAQREAESARTWSEQLFRTAFETAPTGLVLISLARGEEGRVLRVNQSFATFTGRTEAELLQLRVRDLLDPRDVDAHLTYLVRAAGGGEPEPLGVERRFTTPSGEVRHARKSTSVMRPDGGSPYLLAVIEDTTAQRAAEDALVRLAMHDPLTDLPNRALLGDRLERALTADVRQRLGVTVIYADLDGFKPVNDSHGHAAGDLLLQAVAARLSGAVRAGDTVARLGGDEFAVLCPGLAAELVPVVLGRIQRAVAPPVRLPGGAVVRVGLSTGTATVVGGGDPAAVLDEADQAMFANKRRRRADRTAAREDAERLAERIDERMAERAAERGAGRALATATWAAPASSSSTGVPLPAPPVDDLLGSPAVADSPR